MFANQPEEENATTLEGEMEAWMKAVIAAPAEQSYKRGSKEQSAGDYLPHDEQTAEELVELAKHEGLKVEREEMEKIVDWLAREGETQVTCLALVMWRNHDKIQNIALAFEKWWGKNVEKYGGLPLFLIDYSDSDLPHGMHIPRLPALIQYYTDKSAKIYQNIHHVIDIENIIKDTLTPTPTHTHTHTPT